ncbi:hypothetical protein HanIR_Chr14g0712301 [Helianthus annuus]|nr:hypothetical protein HanIR_Chr14g0712301 [Helianthus annuus]
MLCGYQRNAYTLKRSLATRLNATLNKRNESWITNSHKLGCPNGHPIEWTSVRMTIRSDDHPIGWLFDRTPSDRTNIAHRLNSPPYIYKYRRTPSFL